MWFIPSFGAGRAAHVRRLARSRPAPSRNPGRPRLGVEPLEDRTVPSTIVVNTFADIAAPPAGQISLRSALAQAADASHPGADTILLPAGTYSLALGQLTIDDATGKVTIQSSGGPATIDAHGASRVFKVKEGSRAEFQSLMITGGSPALSDGSPDFGGGIYNTGTLTITTCTFSGNSATYGGGIGNFGTLMITGSTLSGNRGSTGGGIGNSGTATITASTLSGNSAQFAGGIGNSGTATITASTLSGNSAQFGGGIGNEGLATTTVTITASTLSGNSASGNGGGIYNSCTATLTTCTLSGNSATGLDGNLDTGDGGGIYNADTATSTITASTLSGNSADRDGGGIYNDGTARARTTIIAGNAGQDIVGVLDPASSYNLIGTGGGLTNGVHGNLVGITEPLLSPLQDNGGPTWTMALLPGSPAIDAGDNAVGLATDQRGVARPQNGRADIGAFESRGFTLAIVAGDTQSATVATAFLNRLQVRVTSPYGEPVAGGRLTFTAPASGAGATFTGGTSTATASIDPLGLAFSPVVTANTSAGRYGVTVDTLGAAFPVGFLLTNTAGAPVSLAAVAGSGQSTTVGYAFATPLQVRVTDQYGNPVPGVSVSFAAPTSGASGLFQGTAVVTTGPDGIASAPTFVANTRSGSYLVTASAGALVPVSFALFNTADVVSQLVITGPTTVVKGKASVFTVTAADRYGNLVTTFNGTVALSSSNNDADLPASLVLSGGTGSFTPIFRKPGTATLLATGPGGLTGSLTLTVAKK